MQHSHALQVTSAITFSCPKIFKVSVNLFRIKYQVGTKSRQHVIKGSWGTTSAIVAEGLCSEKKSASSTFHKVKGFHKRSPHPPTPLIATKLENGANIGFHMILSHLTVKIVFSSPPTFPSLHNNPFPSILGLETSHRGPLDQYLPSLN